MPEPQPLQKVLIANRGEIAVRVIRACKDSGIGSVAVYADPDRDALFVRLADEAHSLGGATPADSYLDIEKIIAVAKESGADSVHPGYGFLAENRDFAQAVLDAGLVWIGPPPTAIENLGDKVKARHIAEKVGAPLAPGTKDPLDNADEAVKFAEENGLPIAIKAAFGGGGRGLKVAREMSEVADAYESAVREAVSAFGRGECFVEKFLDRPRHVETQCLADQHGNVVVVSTRDCSLQRRHQKLVEEAPAPFLVRRPGARSSTTRARRSSRRPATSAPAPASSWSAATGPSPSSRSTPGSRSSTRSPRRSPASTWSARCSGSRPARRSATTTRRSAATPSSSGSTPRTAATTSCPPPAPSPAGTSRRARRTRRRRLRPGRDHPRLVRLPRREADRHRTRPHPGARALPPRAGRVRGRRHAHRHPVPPGGGRRPGVHRGRREVRRLHDLDRDRLRQPARALRRRVRRGRGARASARR